MVDESTANVAATLKGAGWLVKQDELEKATGFTLEKAPEPPVQAPFNGIPLTNKAPTPFKTHDNPFKIPRSVSDGQGDGSGLQELLGAFSRDLGPAAEELKKLLDDLDAGKDIAAAAAALAEKLPELMPDDPAMAAVLAEEMARAFGEDNGRAARPAQPVENKDDQPRGKTTEDTNAGSFASADGGNVGTRDKAKAKAEKRQRQADNKATGISNMSTVESGADCHEFMQSHMLGRIAFYQGNNSEGYLHIKNNPDPDHQVMLKDGNIPNTLAYGKYYADTYQDKSGWIVVNGDKCVFLGKDGDGVKIITAYVSKSKAAIFARRAAIENKGV